VLQGIRLQLCAADTCNLLLLMDGTLHRAWTYGPTTVDNPQAASTAELCSFLSFEADGVAPTGFAMERIGGHTVLLSDAVLRMECLEFVADRYGSQLRRRGVEVPPSRLDMDSLMACMVAGAHRVLGCLWPLSVLIARPSDVSGAAGFQFKGSTPSTFLFPTCVGDHWALLCVRRPCLGRQSWEATLVDTSPGGSMRAHVTEVLTQLITASGWPTGLSLQHVDPPRQGDG
jgi:hypothetical protein